MFPSYLTGCIKKLLECVWGLETKWGLSTWYQPFKRELCTDREEAFSLHIDHVTVLICQEKTHKSYLIGKDSQPWSPRERRTKVTHKSDLPGKASLLWSPRKRITSLISQEKTHKLDLPGKDSQIWLTSLISQETTYKSDLQENDTQVWSHRKRLTRLISHEKGSQARSPRKRLVQVAMSLQRGRLQSFCVKGQGCVSAPPQYAYNPTGLPALPRSASPCPL